VVSGVLVAFLASIAAGGFGSMVGIGGGLILVPVLTSPLLDHDIKTAIAASLVGVIATSVGASGRFLQSGIVDRRLGSILLVATSSGGLLGGLTGQVLDGRTLALLFAVLLVYVAVQMARSPRGPTKPTAAEGAEAEDFDYGYLEPTTGEWIAYRARHLLPGTAISVFAGSVSGLLGVGGGVINVPTMNVLMGVPIRVATTTSTWMLGPTAAASVVLAFASGVLEPLLAAPVALGVFIGARLGARLALRTSQRALRMIFVVVAIVFAIQMVGRAVGA
jgi:uncharacterized membrane protein YfcA